MLEKLASLIFYFLKPIYAFEHRKRIHIGTCVLFEISGKHFLITAAHVLAQRSAIQLYLQNLPLRGGYWTATHQDPDFAVYEMSYEEINALSDCKFFSETLIDGPPIKQGKACQLLGYPVSKNKNFINSDEEVCPEIRLVETRVATSDNSNINCEYYFWVEYQKNLFSPQGMSGGLIATLDISQVPRLQILGMPIEYDKRKTAIKCVRYQLIVNSVQRILGEQSNK
ncbi:hypothetical protein [Billgrantia endophytica]|uniref:Peptidase S1 domain-containing protein n=1 Tax=Billgrantia endophytica TaxID=2033802 RepID=A0A2N7U0T6_9GAMM|nr:hypothetical protein [Halomonas endophytica]PMR74055.1 hypothetical protein C1H69_15410 [Halomonas endophytica]